MADNKIKRKVLRISILGDSSTGKTSIINRFLGNEFSEEHITTIAAEHQNKTVEINREYRYFEIDDIPDEK